MSARAEPASLVEVSRGIGLPKSSAFRYLTSLELRGYVVRGPGEVYRLANGNRALRPQEVARLTAAARPRMDELCRRFGGEALLVVGAQGAATLFGYPG